MAKFADTVTYPIWTWNLLVYKWNTAPTPWSEPLITRKSRPNATFFAFFCGRGTRCNAFQEPCWTCQNNSVLAWILHRVTHNVRHGAHSTLYCLFIFLQHHEERSSACCEEVKTTAWICVLDQMNLNKYYIAQHFDTNFQKFNTCFCSKRTPWIWLLITEKTNMVLSHCNM